MKKISFFFYMTVVLSGCSCKDDVPVPVAPTLPPITQTGENTFGCRIDGQVWLPGGGGIGSGTERGFLSQWN